MSLTWDNQPMTKADAKRLLKHFNEDFPLVTQWLKNAHDAYLRAHCGFCGAHTNPMFMCDRNIDYVYCADCFPGTPCGKGKHEEGCSTMSIDGGDDV
jgi:hypothetical protein